MVPPSNRKGRAYSVHSDIDPVDLPQWLIDCILQGRSPATPGPNGWDRRVSCRDVDLDELRDALRSIPNPHFDWDRVEEHGDAAFAAVGDLLGCRCFASGRRRGPNTI